MIQNKWLKTAISGAMAAVLLAISITGCGNSADTNETSKKIEKEENSQKEENFPKEAKSVSGFYSEEPIVLNLVYAEPWGVSEDYYEIWDTVNAITSETMNVTVNPEPTGWSNLATQINLKLTSNEQCDIMFLPGMFYEMCRKNALYDLTDILEEYAPHIFAYGEAGVLRYDGKAMGISRIKTVNYSYTGIFNAKLVEEYGIEDMVMGVRTLEDITPIFEKVHEMNPDAVCLIPDTATNCILQNWQCIDGINYMDTLSDYLGVIINNSTEVVNLFETKEYENYVNLMHEWALAGYIPKDAATGTEMKDVVFQNDQGLFVTSQGIFNGGNASGEQENWIADFNGTRGYMMALTTPHYETNVYGMGINRACEYPEAALAWLDEMYSNAELYQILCSGIEGEHYVDNGDGTVSYPEGVSDAQGNSYFTMIPGTFGHSANRLVYTNESTDPDYFKKQLEANEGVPFSSSYGFVYDSSNVASQVTACTNVIARYTRALESGSVDPTTELPKFIQKLKEAGIDDIIAEKQRQLDEWLKLQ